MTVTIRRAEPGDEAAILALAAQTLGWDDGDPRYAALYRWKHDQNAFGPSPRWVALEGEQVVGFRVMMRWRYRRGGATLDAVRAVDTATHPDHQGKGIFRRLTLQAIDELRDEGTDFVFNTPNDQSRPGYLKMGWVELGRPPIALAPRLRSLPKIARSRTAADLWSEASDVGRAAADADLSTLASIATAGRRDEAWTTDIDAEFLRWRFGAAPLSYRVVDLTDDGDRSGEGAAMVFRVRRRGAAREATIALAAGGGAAPQRRLLRSVMRQTRADHALIAASTPLGRTPRISGKALSPLVTGRELTGPPPALGDLAFSLGDLELF